MRRWRILIVTAATILTLASLPGSAGAAGPTQVSVGDVAVTEPTNRTGTLTVEVPVTVQGDPGSTITVNWATLTDSAGPTDFVPASGDLVIGPGAAGGAIPIEIRADRQAEPNEVFWIRIQTVHGAAEADGSGMITIRANAGGLSVGDVAVTEPDAGSAEVAVPVTLTGPAKKAVTFAWELRAGTGGIGSDAIAAAGTSTISKGSMGTLIQVHVVGDTQVEPDETIELVVTSISHGSLADGHGVITLRNTDVSPPPTPIPTFSPDPTPSPAPTSPPGPYTWQPPAGSIPATGTVVYLESSPGDFIGSGQTYGYTKADSVLQVNTFGNLIEVIVDGDEHWHGFFEEPADFSTVQTGAWDDVNRYPFYNPSLSFFGEGRGCNELLGRFVVDEVSFEAGVVRTLTLRFEQRCQITGPPLRGYVRYDATDPTEPPPPADASGFPWSVPPGALPATGNAMYFESSPGDYIGGGRTRLFTEADWTMIVNWSVNRFQLYVDDPVGDAQWSADFEGRYNQERLVPGLYDDVMRFPFHNAAKGGLSITGENRACNRVSGAFAIDDAVYLGSELRSIAIRFVQHCEENGPPLYGVVRWAAP